ncbi:hypothetical protein VPFG_00155 [Vibrio phage nt-1]|uniref:Uncharacterized protein n=1 Tax=Vibrio phage nt-1 TaxID=115992 RepID=R9TJ92_9CAUD|nr:hypothetical protein VPFG_00155 [Vibrio phage nt-1]AGN30157.1 hypothetical protein VPFG_00155 [Vibrio phage nt-1]
MSFETKIICYAAPVTEYEPGWSRPDGYIIAKTKEDLLAKGEAMRQYAQTAKYGYELIGECFIFEPTQKAIDELSNRDYVWTYNNFSEYGKVI